MTETLKPRPINEETAHLHDVVAGEVITPEEPFIGGLQSEQAPSGKSKERRNRHRVVESIDPANIHVHGEVTWAHIQDARNILLKEQDEAKRSEYAAEIAEVMIPEPEDGNEVYKRHRAEIVSLLLASPKKFAREAKRHERSQARLDRVKVKHQKPSKEAADPVDVDEILSEEPISEPTRRSLRRNVKQMDRQFGGLVGEIAETGTNPAYLESQREKFIETMNKHGYEVNEKNRSSTERQELRKMVSALAEFKFSNDEERKAYEDQLVDMFHNYVKLSDEDREQFNDVLADRHEVAAKLGVLDNEHADVKESRERIPGRIRRSLGAAAIGLMSKSREIWNDRKERKADLGDEQLALFDEKPYRQRRRGAREALATSGESLRNIPHNVYHNLTALMHDRNVRYYERLAAMTEEERAKEIKKDYRRKLFAAGAGTLAVGSLLLASRFGIGIDNPFSSGDKISAGGNDSPGGNDSLLTWPPDFIEDLIDNFDGNDPQDVQGGTELQPKPVDASGHLTRGELFDGSGGGRKLTAEGHEALAEQLNGYKVKQGDTVWDLSERFLKDQGIKNPTDFEIDATKDILRSELRATNSVDSNGWLSVGDKIRIK